MFLKHSKIAKLIRISATGQCFCIGEKQESLHKYLLSAKTFQHSGFLKRILNIKF